MNSSSGDSDDDEQQGSHPVRRGAHERPEAGDLRLLDVQQRQAGHRADRDARAGDVGQGGRDDEVDAGALELPAEPAQRGAGHARRRGDGDGVGPRVGEHAGQAVERAEHGYGLAIDDHAAALGQRDADDLVAGGRLATDPPYQLDDLRPVAGDDEAMAEPAVVAGPVDVLADRVAADQQRDRARGQRDADEATRDLELEPVRDDRDDGADAEAGDEDPAVLLDAAAEEPRLVRAVAAQHEQPEEAQQWT